MDDIDLRKQAITLYLNGIKPSIIVRDLNKSRQWFYKWLKRYQEYPTNDWFIEQSRRPKTIPKKLSSGTEQLILDIRQRLESIPYSQIGAVSIQWEIKKLGIEPPPTWTIDRILKRHNVVRKKEKAVKKLNEYPGSQYINVHQLDFVGPRYIKNYGRIYSVNVIHDETHCAQVNPVKGKATEYVLDSVIRFWQQFGIPDFLQMDNELSFRGSNRHPRSFGQLIRFALCHQVCPIFIPPREPWRNGIIEHFNNTFDKKFFRSQLFKNLDDIRFQAHEFENFHNEYHRYKANNNRTPMDMFERYKPYSFLDQDYKLPDNIPLIEGNIILIRFIRGDRKLDVFGESFTMPKELIYSYIEALISIESHTLKIYQDHKLVLEIDYPVPVDWM